ncbi:MAG: hypothetical protein SVV67_11095 [Bacillota bacterium]|nr:hypothetical protein [Bacillota bacterium]
MIFLDLSTALIISVFMTWLFCLATGAGDGKRRKIGLFWIFVILIFTTWAGGVWIKPIGPALCGIHWLSFLLTGSVVTLILIIAIPRTAPRGRHETIDMLESIEQKREVKQAAYFTLSLFFWVLLFLLILAILLRYIIGI